jgi:hypothetical protein
MVALIGLFWFPHELFTATRIIRNPCFLHFDDSQNTPTKRFGDCFGFGHGLLGCHSKGFALCRTVFFDNKRNAFHTVWAGFRGRVN